MAEIKIEKKSKILEGAGTIFERFIFPGMMGIKDGAKIDKILETKAKEELALFVFGLIDVVTALSALITLNPVPLLARLTLYPITRSVTEVIYKRKK